jgi:hypothetical protein
MRLNTVTKAMHDVIRDPAHQQRMALYTSADFVGGWEAWMQCETFFRIAPNARQTCIREQPYPGLPARRCDFMIANVNDPADSVTLWAELKVQRGAPANVIVPNLLRSFSHDVDKLNALAGRIPEPQNLAAAFAVIPRSARELLSAGNRDLFTGLTGLATDRVRLYTSSAVDSTAWGANSPVAELDTVLLVYALYK